MIGSHDLFHRNPLSPKTNEDFPWLISCPAWLSELSSHPTNIVIYGASWIRETFGLQDLELQQTFEWSSKKIDKRKTFGCIYPLQRSKGSYLCIIQNKKWFMLYWIYPPFLKTFYICLLQQNSTTLQICPVPSPTTTTYITFKPFGSLDSVSVSTQKVMIVTHLTK